jgi:cation diffusion facilitator CzcD-associated flavoprotein CzcO
VRVFGQPMRTWRTLMPLDMLLRSDWEHTNLSAPGDAGTLDAWTKATGEQRVEPTPLSAFLRYGDWFRERFVPDLDEREVTRVEPAGGGFRVHTGAGSEVEAGQLVLAVGVTPFPNRPAAFERVEDDRVSFAIAEQSFEALRGRRLIVVGAGQNGLESALLAHRCGAEVEILVRSQVRWYAPHEPYTPRGPLQRRLYRLAYPVVGFGPPPLNRVVQHPDAFARLPAALRERLNRRILRAGGAPWIRAEIDGHVPISEGVEVVRVEAGGDAVRLHLSDGSAREADHVIVAVGYRFDLARLTILDEAVRRSIALSGRWPRLDRHLRSSNRAVFMAGYPAEGQFGPLSRFVEGTRFAASRIAAAL